jgi:membrane protein DedA with SNARE-associated domain
MEEFLRDWGYLGVFLGILATGIPFMPLPEELPVVIGGVLAGHGTARWWIMLPVCMLAVVIGDAMLYGIGRWSGPRIRNSGWVKKHVLPPDRLQSIEANFQKHGVKILLFARLTPGIRAPIFVTAGIMRVPLPLFILADAIYAIPGVTILFFLGFWFTDSIISLVETGFSHVRSIVVATVLLAIAGYLVYRFLRRPVVTGGPEEMPPLVEQVTHTIEHVTHRLDEMRTRIMHSRGRPPADKQDKTAHADQTVRIDPQKTLHIDADKTVQLDAGPNGQPGGPPGQESPKPAESDPAKK